MENALNDKNIISQPLKGQMSMLVLVLGIMFFIMLGVFLFTSNIKPKNTDYANLYVHNLLLTSLRSYTGYSHPCMSVSDTLSCAYLTPNRFCSSDECFQLAPSVAEETIRRVLKQNYDFLLIVEPENWDTVGGERIVIGNPAIENIRPKYTANEKILAYGSNLRIVLMIAEKR
ncbi:MAG: hypothetical protein GXO64_01615 [Candidatus Micrarchaeota archaeon]|nr:hypothetical protein [Candidatus Micrarchaeota archaeon]